ncbi:hypothetical protein Q2T42_08915 [Leptolyngbya boryana CZ1]|uniref:Antitoxin n=1 Tax=Leptolyngbya boryana CZ1 TaxID=3060204 RepID=A0AA96WZF9_LEPBY|nr:hypothetical protein [Leptolyngbya boryana]WNZ47953.1 hypothetical protein Q2T42_08915 [Leptolyngbya boryana CZ1]
MSAQNYPFAQEFITDAEGQIRKVVINITDYRKLIEAIEDEGLYRAMLEARREQPLSLEEARKEMEKE